jgi:hypothetical protein
MHAHGRRLEGGCLVIAMTLASNVNGTHAPWNSRFWAERLLQHTPETLTRRRQRVGATGLA